jgi:hypothetical protein
MSFRGCRTGDVVPGGGLAVPMCIWWRGDPGGDCGATAALASCVAYGRWGAGHVADRGQGRLFADAAGLPRWEVGDGAVFGIPFQCTAVVLVGEEACASRARCGGRWKLEWVGKGDPVLHGVACCRRVARASCIDPYRKRNARAAASVSARVHVHVHWVVNNKPRHMIPSSADADLCIGWG